MKGKATLVLAGVVLVGASAMASAAKPAMTHQQKQELAAKARQKTAAFRATQPHTVAQGEATLRAVPGGGRTARVPTALWSTLGVQRDANNGQVRIVESDGTSAPATEGVPNE